MEEGQVMALVLEAEVMVEVVVVVEEERAREVPW